MQIQLFFNLICLLKTNFYKNASYELLTYTIIRTKSCRLFEKSIIYFFSYKLYIVFN